MSFFVDSERRYGARYAEFSHFCRRIAFAIDANPHEILQYIHTPAVQFLLSDRDSTALQRTEYLEAFAYGDPGVLLACPGPSLSGLMLRELGLPSEIECFYRTVKETGCHTFFALSEPNKGSDANNIQTRLIKNNTSFYLQGEKSFFGNGVVAQTGIVLARLSDGPLGIRAVWLTQEMMNSSTIEKWALPMFALRGAQISGMRFTQTAISRDQILGHHLSSCENGMLGIMKVFNRLRTGVGALAIGQAQAVYDLTFSLKQKQRHSLRSLFADLDLSLLSARHMLHSAAIKIDSDPLLSSPVSLAKANATQVAETVITQCMNLCSLDDLMTTPWLMKAYRDIFCFEYMEGTSNMQKKQIRSPFS
jgi:alkylation response protein AidB-like acyl-CoA dehydrogenase